MKRYIEQKPNTYHIRRQRADPVADKGQRNPRNRHDTCGHTNVDEHLETNHGTNARREKHAIGVTGRTSDDDTAINQDKQ